MFARNKIFIIIGMMLILLFSTLFIIRLLSGEDDWICVNHQWASHGHPDTPAPDGGCELVVEPPIQDVVKPVLTPTTTDEEYYQRIVSKLRDEPGQETRLYSPDMSGRGTANDWKSPMLVKGALPNFWYFEATAYAKLKDGNDKILAEGSITSQGDWTQPGLIPFETTFTFPNPITPIGTLTLIADNPSGMPENERFESYQVILWPKVKVYFNDLSRDPDMKDCDQVYYSERFVSPTPAIARAALEELLKGPIKTDKFERSMITNINPGVKIQKLTIENGIAKVDFSSELERAVGGSCKTEAIRAQITETLKQFPTVQSVIISIDGRTEDILQP